jgi:hypothetical protein
VYLRTKFRAPGTSVLAAFLRAWGEVLPWSLGRDRTEVLRLTDPLPAAIEALGRLGLVR